MLQIASPGNLSNSLGNGDFDIRPPEKKNKLAMSFCHYCQKKVTMTPRLTLGILLHFT